MLPTISTLYKNIQRDADLRGTILSIVDHPVKNVSIIDSVKGAVRSNHYHHVDFHFMYVLEGSIDYFFKPIDSDKVNYLKVSKGDTIFTPAKEIHSCIFQEYTSLVVSSGFPRDQETYEKDTVRVEFVNLENFEAMLKKYGNN